MTPNKVLVSVLFALFSGNSTSVAAQTPQAISPAEAVRWAAATRPYGKSGLFLLRVQSISMRGPLTILNSEHDPRNANNLSVALPADVVKQLEAQYGPISSAFIGKTISVKGVAKWAIVSLVKDGERTLSSYPQTEVRVSDPKKIQFVEGGS